MASTVNTSVDYEKLDTSKGKIDSILTDMLDTAAEIDDIKDELFMQSPAHDGCFDELPSELESFRNSIYNGPIYSDMDTLYQTVSTAIDCFQGAENEDINAEAWAAFIGGLSSSYKPESIKEDEEVEWKFHYNSKDFNENMTEEEKKLFDETNAETARLATQTEALIYRPDEYESQIEWNAALIQKYLDEGYTEEEAEALAKYERYIEKLDETGAEKVYGYTSEAWEEKWEAITEEEYTDGTDSGTEDGTGDGADDSADDGADDGADDSAGDGDSTDNGNGDSTNGGGGGGTPPDDNGIKYRKEDPTPEPNNTPQRQDTPTPKPEEKPSTTPEETPVKEDEKEPTIIEDEEKVPETPSEEKPSTTPEPETPPSNNNSNNNQTNTGENSNNSGAVNNTPSTGGNTNNGNNNYYAPSNNGGGNYNGGGSSNAPATGAGTPNENASTTTPSAPESDAGINDNSGETLDVISIDKDGGKSSASTSSNDGGSVVPTILGVGVAGAAAVAGAKILHDKKKKENEYIYEEDGSTESDNSFANLESYTGDDTVDTTDTMSPGKYRAGSANNLVLEGSPSDIKIDESIADIPNQKEELE